MDYQCNFKQYDALQATVHDIWRLLQGYYSTMWIDAEQQQCTGDVPSTAAVMPSLLHVVVPSLQVKLVCPASSSSLLPLIGGSTTVSDSSLMLHVCCSSLECFLESSPSQSLLKAAVQKAKVRNIGTCGVARCLCLLLVAITP